MITTTTTTMTTIMPEAGAPPVAAVTAINPAEVKRAAVVHHRLDLTTVESQFDQARTTERLIAEISRHGLTLFARIDHAAFAAAAGLSLRPTELVIFGNPRAGTLLMQENQAMGVDLPLKALVWTDVLGKTWVTYPEPLYLAQRHKVDAPAVVSAMTLLLEEIITRSVRPVAPDPP